jgi:hypothetical protein
LKGLTADENFRILRKYDEDVIDDEEDGESSEEGDETNQIRNQVSKFNLSRKGKCLLTRVKNRTV